MCHTSTFNFHYLPLWIVYNFAVAKKKPLSMNIYFTTTTLIYIVAFLIFTFHNLIIKSRGQAIIRQVPDETSHTYVPYKEV